MSVQNYLDHDFNVARISTTNIMPSALDSLIMSHCSSNGWTAVGSNILTSTPTSSLRNDITKGLELINLYIGFEYLLLKAGQMINGGDLGGLVLTKSTASITWPVDAVILTDGDGDSGYHGTFLLIYIKDAVNSKFIYNMGLANRERETPQFKLTQALSSVSNPVTVLLPTDSIGNYYMPGIYNPAAPNFKSKVQIHSRTSQDNDILDIVNVTSINEISGVATFEFSNPGVKTFSINSLGGIDPQPLYMTENLSGETIQNGLVESITLKELNKSSSAPHIPDILSLAYATTDGDISGRILGLRSIYSSQDILDGHEIRTWKEPDQDRDRFWQAIDLSPNKLAIPKTNYIVTLPNPIALHTFNDWVDGVDGKGSPWDWRGGGDYANLWYYHHRIFVDKMSNGNNLVNEELNSTHGQMRAVEYFGEPPTTGADDVEGIMKASGPNNWLDTGNNYGWLNNIKGAFSFEVWMYNYYQYEMIFQFGTTLPQWILLCNTAASSSDRKIYLYAYDQLGVEHTNWTPTSWGDEPYHIIVTFDGRYMSIWKQSINILTIDIGSGNTLRDITSDIKLMSSYGQTWYGRRTYKMAWWDRVLSQIEIKTAYNKYLAMDKMGHLVP